MTHDNKPTESSDGLLKKRRLPKLMACIRKDSLENMRSKALYELHLLDANGIRRKKFPLYECLIWELRENGYKDSADYLEDLIYDNKQLVAKDDIGIVIDLRNREDYLHYIASCLQLAEKARDREDTKKECMELLNLALYYAEQGKGIIWLAEKFFLAAIAIASKYILDGGRLKSICKYHYAKFLLDKFPGSDPDESFLILTDVRDSAIGKDWMLYEAKEEGEEVPSDTVFEVTALQLNRVLLMKARDIRNTDPSKAERLCRLAERRANDANEINRTAETIIEIGICQLMMNNLHNAQKTFERAYKIHLQNKNVKGLCECKMHLAAVMQRLGDHETAAKILTEMGAIAMEHHLRGQLGRALHLLGELHVRRERPDLGTEHLSEAFGCFMGFRLTEPTVRPPNPNEEDDKNTEEMGIIYAKEVEEMKFVKEAEQSRFMMAVSAGQERMASYFNLIREADTCAVAQLKTIEWKLSRSGWWISKKHHDHLPCMCPVHNRTPLDVLASLIHGYQNKEEITQSRTWRDDISSSILPRGNTIYDMRFQEGSFE